MKFIKVKNENGKDIIVNLLNVTSFFPSDENGTIIYFTTPEDYVKVTTSIEAFYNGLNVINDSSNVWDFSKLK